ncbi:MAG: hypothetical protein JWQ76_1754 [Ramlibacter sp.]|nr:hypothetical protein [Ramlibacter sp.]
MPAITADSHDDRQQLPQNRLLWGALGALVLVQLVAFWMLCSHQVRQAEVRDTAIAVQQMALADCLQYIPGSTIASCTSQLQQAKATQPAATTAVTGAMPVSYNYR